MGTVVAPAVAGIVLGLLIQGLRGRRCPRCGERHRPAYVYAAVTLFRWGRFRIGAARRLT